MELRQLEYFLKCAEKGSLTRAAEELYTTQPHVSQVIRALERELGVSLFRRTGAGVALTDDGERIRFYAENAVKNAALIGETARDHSGERLRIAANPSSRLAVLAGEYICAHIQEGLTMQYTECGIEQMTDLLQHRQYDLGFIFMPENKRSALVHLAEQRHLNYTPLLQSDLVAHCGKKSPFYGRKVISAEELNGCEFIQMEDDFFSLEDLLMEHPAFYSGKWTLKKLVRTNSDHLMMDMLKTTALCNLGSYWLRDGGEDDPLSRAVVDGFQGRVSFGYLQIDNRLLNEPAQRFLAVLQGLLH